MTLIKPLNLTMTDTICQYKLNLERTYFVYFKLEAWPSLPKDFEKMESWKFNSIFADSQFFLFFLTYTEESWKLSTWKFTTFRFSMIAKFWSNVSKWNKYSTEITFQLIVSLGPIGWPFDGVQSFTLVKVWPQVTEVRLCNFLTHLYNKVLWFAIRQTVRRIKSKVIRNVQV